MATKTLLKILIVDDDGDDRELAALALRRAGVTEPVNTVSSAVEAIAYLRGDGAFADRALYPYPSLLITDLKMAGGDGFTLLDHLKSTPEYRVIPTVVMSSSSDPDDIKQAYMLGASSYFVKPSEFDGLERIIQLLYHTWLLAELPAVDANGRQLETDSTGKLGERFQHNPGAGRIPSIGESTSRPLHRLETDRGLTSF